MSKIKVVTFYKFVCLEDYKELRDPLLRNSIENGIRGTFILAREGINATIAGNEEGINAIIDYLSSDSRFHNIDYKFSYDKEMPFYRMKVKLKNELIPIGIKSVDPTKVVGTYISPAEWNELINDPEVLLIDTRNNYEVEVGSFKGAIRPDINNFRDFPEYVKNNLNPKEHRKVAMFCTGGIRCEKASSFMLEEGFEEVYHLKGGILKYLEDVSPEESLWDGECFVFDNRTSLDMDLQSGNYSLCSNCRHPLSVEDRNSVEYEIGISCPNCYNKISNKRRESLKERQKQIELAKTRNQQHLGYFPQNNKN